MISFGPMMKKGEACGACTICAQHVEQVGCGYEWYVRSLFCVCLCYAEWSKGREVRRGGLLVQSCGRYLVLYAMLNGAMLFCMLR